MVGIEYWVCFILYKSKGAPLRLTQSKHSMNIYWIEILELNRTWYKKHWTVCAFTPQKFLLWWTIHNIKFTTEPFYVCSSVALSMFTLWWDHPPTHLQKFFIIPNRNSVPITQKLPIQQIFIYSFNQQLFNEHLWLGVILHIVGGLGYRMNEHIGAFCPPENTVWGGRQADQEPQVKS